jgi:hypothetical protein
MVTRITFPNEFVLFILYFRKEKGFITLLLILLT